ncbi:MAG: hypothetical protein LKCHEGNO_00485 [Burkholderiaceae bacterium]|nr:hypothetical protein [Burkholderiaceae bacterium]
MPGKHAYRNRRSNGWYDSPPNKGLRGVGRVYAGWGLSQPFYMQELWRDMGYSSLEDFLVAFWEGFFLPKDANNLSTPSSSMTT